MEARSQIPAPRQTNALEYACRQLVHLIDLGTYRPGQRLPAADELAVTIGVSRPIVLQALTVLQVQGRVQVRRGSGAWVCPLSATNADARRAQVWQNRSEIRQMCALREMLEVGVARRLAVIGLPPERVTEARTLIQAMADCDDLEVNRPLDTAFHGVLIASLGMPLVEEALQDARARSAAAFEFLNWPADRHRTTLREHEQLLEAIVAGDPDEAARMASAHVGVSARLIEELLGGDGAAILRPPTLPSDGPGAG